MLKELGTLKKFVRPALFYSENIRKLLLGDDYQTLFPTEEQIMTALASHIHNHLSIDKTKEAAKTCIFFDAAIPQTSPAFQTCSLQFYALCPRNLLEAPALEGYEGNRVDMLCQMIDELLLKDENIRNFGIGKFSLSSLKPYGELPNTHGKILEYTVPDFR